jgi:type I restriction enzyme R subunit
MRELITAVADSQAPFSHIDRTAKVFNQIHDAQQVMDTDDKRSEFAAKFMRCQGLFEFLWPDLALRPIEEDYRFLAKIYDSIAPSKAADMLLWQRLGAKTMELVHEHLNRITIDSDQLEKIALDEGAIEAIKDLTLFPESTPGGKKVLTALEVLLRLEERIKRRFGDGPADKVWRSLSDRLEMLRLSRISSAEESVEFLKLLLKIAKDVLEAEKADDEGRIADIKVVDPRKGALTQIFEEFRPDGVPVVIENVVEQVDSLVSPVRGTGWQTSHPGDRHVRQELRVVLKNNGLPISGELFDRAYAYISENY